MAAQWKAEQDMLREILSSSQLVEHKKWGKPCFCHGDKNIAILQPMKPHLALMFFKGELLRDPTGVLEPVGPNSRSGRRILLTSTAEVSKLKSTIKALVREAIAVAEAGLQVDKPAELELAPELQASLATNKALATAFFNLTPGRQREYNLHVSGAKQASTRENRVHKCIPKILSGKGFRE